MSTPNPSNDQKIQERRSQLRGLLYLAGAILLFAIARFGFSRVFTPFWWRL
jgi:hypothetical protein